VILAHAVGTVLWALVAALDRLGMEPRRLAWLSRFWLVLAVTLLAVAAAWPDAWSAPGPMDWALASRDVALSGSQAAVIAASEATLPRIAGSVPWDAVIGRAVQIGAAIGLVRLVIGVARLGWSVRSGRRLHRIGRAEVRAAAGSAAVAAPGSAIVLLQPGSDWRIALRHEATHHRHGDAAWAWAWALVGALGWPNPAIAALVARVRLVEELACDDRVVQRVQPKIYARALLRAAGPVHAVAPAAASPHALRRRISMLAQPRTRLVPVLPALVVGAALLAGTALAGGPSVPRDLPRLARESSGPGWTIPADGPVADALAAIVASPKARTFYREGLVRREDLAELVDGALADAGLPPQLAAVPLVESGYRNLGASAGDGVWTEDNARDFKPGTSRAPGRPGRGVWMFIAPTAREYGLRTGATDDRFDVPKETAAAVALLAHDFQAFGDWGLAVAAYNQGENKVRSAIAAQGTRDVWALTEAGALNDYSAEVFAASILVDHPEVVSR
jgi:membrane-bound lytic murein transglycosylase D